MQSLILQVCLRVTRLPLAGNTLSCMVYTAFPTWPSELPSLHGHRIGFTLWNRLYRPELPISFAIAEGRNGVKSVFTPTRWDVNCDPQNHHGGSPTMLQASRAGREDQALGLIKVAPQPWEKQEQLTLPARPLGGRPGDEDALACPIPDRLPPLPTSAHWSTNHLSRTKKERERGYQVRERQGAMTSSEARSLRHWRVSQQTSPERRALRYPEPCKHTDPVEGKNQMHKYTRVHMQVT